MNRSRIGLVGVLLAPLLVVPAAPAAAAQQEDCGPPLALHTNDFPAVPTVDNRFFPLTPGTKWVLKGTVDGAPHTVVTTVTDLTKVIDGVRSMVVLDEDFGPHRDLQEAELAFMAQDRYGTVWNLLRPRCRRHPDRRDRRRQPRDPAARQVQTPMPTRGSQNPRAGPGAGRTRLPGEPGCLRTHSPGPENPPSTPLLKARARTSVQDRQKRSVGYRGGSGGSQRFANRDHDSEIRADPRVTIVARAGWRWATVEGDAAIIGPDDPHPGVDSEALRVLLRDIFRAAGGTHDDWDTYDKVMAEERRAAVLITPSRVYTNP